MGHKPSPQHSNGVLKKIIQTLRAHMPELRRRYRVKRLGVFGSYARGTQHECSDLDILVEVENGEALTLLEFAALRSYLIDLLEIRIDLVERSWLEPHLARHILQEVIEI